MGNSKTELEKRLAEKRIYKELIQRVMDNSVDYEDPIETIKLLLSALDSAEYWIRELEGKVKEEESEGEQW